MAGTVLAPALPIQHPSKSKKRRSQKRRTAERALQRSSSPVWTDVEEAFFAAAPPDEPEPAAAPESFDDLGGPAPSVQVRASWLQALLTALRPAFRRRAPATRS